MSTELDTRSDDERAADAVVGALGEARIGAAFSRDVLAAAKVELRGSRSAWRRTQRLTARVLVPVTLLVCAAGIGYRFVRVAEDIYVSHADGAR